jgi:hypothetical protein
MGCNRIKIAIKTRIKVGFYGVGKRVLGLLYYNVGVRRLLGTYFRFLHTVDSLLPIHTH